ncbi:glycoside-pentoside-hexuronide (GPH):cation symporter, partial [Bifidobacterium adolescentis]
FSYIFTGKHQESQSGWTCFAIIVAILGVLTVCSVAFGTKESSSTLRTKAEDNGGPLAAFKALAQNDQLLWVALSYLLYAIANVATTGVLMYMFKFILNNYAAYSIVGVVSVIAGIIMAPLYPILNKRIPRRYLYLGGMVLMVLGYLLFIVGTDNLAVVTVGLVFFYLPQTFIQMTAILSLTDSIEYGQLKNGKRNEAVTLSVRPMLDKIAGACSNGIVGAVAIAAGMIGSATAADMTAANIHTFKVWAFYVPLAVIILSGVVFLLKVKITEKMHADIVKQLEEQLNEG